MVQGRVLGLHGRARGAVAAIPEVDVMLPVYNEAVALEASVRRLHTYLLEQPGFAARIVIVDNGSTDGTSRIGEWLAVELADVAVIRIEQAGRGRALREAWAASTADIVAYMDIDLSTDIEAFAALIDLIVSDGADVAIGSRLAEGARVVRSRKREVMSRTYNLILRAALGLRVRDAQCGFKALRREAAELLVPHVEDHSWFFDTELLVLAQRAGLRIAELPVAWVEDPGSTVKLLRTALDDLRGVARLRAGAGRVITPPLRSEPVELSA